MICVVAEANVRRRPLLLAIAGGGAVVGALGVASRTGLLGEGSGADPEAVLRLHTSAPGMRSLELRLGDDVLPRVDQSRWGTRQLPTTTHSMVGFTWRDSGEELEIEVSSRVTGTWQPWRRMPRMHDVPDPGSVEASGVTGTDLVWIGKADGIQVRVAGKRPADLTLVLLHPARRQRDTRAGRLGRPASSPTAARAAPPAVPRPEILNRRAWGADPGWRDGEPVYNQTIQQVHVHHTVNSNNYAEADVPALIRGMYRYHTHNLGWSDIAYNFLVDRFGRIWVGRAGGAARPVRGAHTLGFNDTSTGIAMIGNYELVRPSPASVTAIVQLAAWKLSKYQRNPEGRVSVRSTGSDRFRSGQVVRLPVIDGHRDTNDTACPGRHLYEVLPAIRSRTKARMDRFHGSVVITEPFAISGAAVVGQALTVRRGSHEPTDAVPRYTWMRDAAAIPGASGPEYRPTVTDVGAIVSVRVEVRAPGLAPAGQTLTMAEPVRDRAVLDIRATSRSGSVFVTMSVTTAANSGVPTGSVTVRLPGRRKVTELIDGRARVRFRRPPRGTHQLTVHYDGDSRVSPANDQQTITVGG
jgi:hypothetical protein